MERIFAHFKDPNPPSSAGYDPGDPDSYDQYIRAMMGDAVDYEQAFLQVDRNNAQLYYYGMEPMIGPYNPGSPYIGEDPNATLGEILNKDNANQPNRSTYVSTDVRDAVMMMLPSLIRLFGASESPVFLVPRSEAESDMAEQGTDYTNYVFWNDNPGFLILYGAIKDALTVKAGFVKWWSEDFKEVKRKKFVNVTADQLQMLLSENPSAKLLEIGKPVRQPQPPMPPGPPPAAPTGPPPGAPVPGGPSPGGPPPGPLAAGGPAPGPPGPPVGGQPPPGGPPPGPMAGAPPPALPPSLMQPPPPVYDHAVVEFEISKPLIKAAGVPPEEMRLDRYARTFKDSRLVGHQRIVPVDQLIAMGYDREQCMEHIQTSESTFSTEPQLRNPGRFMGTRLGDGVKYGEWYVKVDKDGDGTPELRYICTFGDENVVVSDEYANRVKFAVFGCDPISHTIIGDSLADYTEDIQRIKTNMMRAILDSAAEAINPKTVINELMVTVDDALNDDLGAVIRTRGDPSASVMFTNTPFLGQAAMPVVEMLNDQLQRRTGLSDAAKGLDPKALQSSTMIGVEAVINGAQERIELVARVLCETGFKDLFAGLYNEICENPNQQRTLKIRGKFVPYDTSTFDSTLSVEVNPNLGKGSDMTRMLALNQIKQDQQLLVTQMGLNNPICGVMEMLNTQTDMLALANIKNVSRYFKTPNPQQLQAMQSAPKAPDPMAMAAQAQMEKVRSETAKAVGQQNLDRVKMQQENQFKHQQLHFKTALDLQKLDIEGQKAGLDHHVELAKLGSQLMSDDQDRQQQDQQGQVDMAGAQNDADAQARQHQQAMNDAQLKAAQQAQQHQQAMSQIASQHTQAMTKMAADHHAAMSGVGAKNAATVVGALSGDADRLHEQHQSAMDRLHQTHQAALDRDSAERTTAATLSTQSQIAKTRPKPKK
jgi:hypothetical protein